MNDATTTSPTALVKTSDALRRRLAAARAARQTIGLVPTMGALHEGHLSLLDASRRQSGLTVVTIFVNPTQFGPGEDFGRYPRTIEADLQMLAARGADVVFAPETEAMYGPRDATMVEVAGPSEHWEGKFRPTHFRGVATIVLKLLNLVQPDRAYFGRKDYQQSLIVRRMVDDLNVPVEIVVCPTVREADGLAMSSRNRYLSPAERQRALAIFGSLNEAKRLFAAGTREAQPITAQMREMLSAAELAIDYVGLADLDTLEPVERIERPTVALIAARVGTTRLIDNEIIG